MLNSRFVAVEDVKHFVKVFVVCFRGERFFVHGKNEGEKEVGKIE
ncbi:hypothetical protein [Thermaerobacillus caldiproteolyticus]|uniref:Uncharacterized protein n=1 Tax=Thermaerobacillus caldiproteolyticus TaxID=247480 RepID=A0A7V9Z9W0_9BACL|nr:hypothetical protein [Anoxybacillus caldiproteolyticus]MBA2876644.1 hypothetical protein [Anoxybacillus caldiproteolyticus]